MRGIAAARTMTIVDRMRRFMDLSLIMSALVRYLDVKFQPSHTWDL